MPDMPNASTDESQLRQANEEVYKHSLELAVRNKTLSLLRELYQISILSLAEASLAEKVANTVREALELELVSIMMYDPATDTLSPLAVSRSERLEKVASEGEYPFKSHPISKATNVPLLKAALAGEGTHTEHIADLWGTVLPEDQLKKVSEEGHIKTLSIYPLMIEEKATGILAIGLNRPYESLNAFERESLASLVDVTAIALDRARLYEEIQAANQRQESLIHFVSHEVKGYLAKDSAAFAALAEGDYGVLPDSMKPLVTGALEQSRDGARSVIDILQASNQKKGTIEYKKEPFDLAALTKEWFEKVKPLAEKKSLAFTLSVDESGAPYTVTGDGAQTGDHVLRNLFENSVNYTPSGSVAISLAKSDGKAVITITDTGVGISDEDKKRLFTEGGKGKDSLKVNVHSTGYGLFIAKNIIEAEGGSVRAESDGPGKGSVFIVELPAA